MKVTIESERLFAVQPVAMEMDAGDRRLPRAFPHRPQAKTRSNDLFLLHFSIKMSLSTSGSSTFRSAESSSYNSVNRAALAASAAT